jgi:hypothetical protein
MNTNPNTKESQLALFINKLFLYMLVMMCSNLGLAQMHPAKTREKEIIYSGQGKIILETGVELEGKITHSRVTQRRVHIRKADNTLETYKSKEVKNFSIGDIFFEKIITPGLGIKDFDFAVVLSNPSSKVRVYEVCWQDDIGMGTSGEILWPTHWEYYVLFPSQPKLRRFSDIDLIPFAKKVSKLVEECADVSAKIKAKEKGYSISLISTDDDKLNVFKNISNEYINCMK